MPDYSVTIVCESTDGSRLMESTIDLPDGLTAQVNESELVLVMPVEARDGREALSVARSLAEDLCRALAAAYSSFRPKLLDERNLITRTDATFVADGPIPEADVAEGNISEAGLALCDPDGLGRRAQKVFRLRANAIASRQFDDSIRRFANRGGWTSRVRSASDL